MRERARYQWIIAALLVGALGVSAAAESPEPTPRSASVAQHYTIEYEPMNSSGVEATAELTIEGDELTIRVEASGLEAGEVHPMNIRGHKGRDATVPPETADTSGDGLIDMVEGQPYFGAIVRPLTPFPSTADFSYEQTFTIEPDSFGPVEQYTSVLHGMSVGGSYVQTLPVACGEIKPQP